MAKINSTNSLQTPKVKRQGIHAKTKVSKSKSSKNYKKKYRGQGR